jgi:hypothetical protein
MSENSWDITESDLSNNSEDDGALSESSLDSTFSNLGVSTTLLPLSVLGVVAFLQEAVLVESLSSIGFTGLALDALVTAFSVVGFITVLSIVFLAVITFIGIISLLAVRSVAGGAVGLLGVLYFGGSYTIAATFLSNMPLLVGYVLGSTILIYSGIVIASVVVLPIFFVLEG